MEVTAVNVPEILGYNLQYARDSYSDIKDYLDTMISRAPLVESALTATYGSISTFGGLLTSVFILSVIDYALDKCSVPYCKAAEKIVYAAEKALRKLAIGKGSVIVVVLATLLAIAGTVSLWLLHTENDYAYDGWLTDEPDDIHTFWNLQLKSSVFDASTGQLKSSVFDDNSIAKDLMIVKIFDLKIESWNIVVGEKQVHPATAQGIIKTNYLPVDSSTTVDFYGRPYSGGQYDSEHKIWNFVDFNSGAAGVVTPPAEKVAKIMNDALTKNSSPAAATGGEAGADATATSPPAVIGSEKGENVTATVKSTGTNGVVANSVTFGNSTAPSAGEAGSNVTGTTTLSNSGVVSGSVTSGGEVYSGSAITEAPQLSSQAQKTSKTTLEAVASSSSAPSPPHKYVPTTVGPLPDSYKFDCRITDYK